MKKLLGECRDFCPYTFLYKEEPEVTDCCA